MSVLTWTSQLKWNELGGAIDAPDSLSVNGGLKREQRRSGKELFPDNDLLDSKEKDSWGWRERESNVLRGMHRWLSSSQLKGSYCTFACFINDSLFTLYIIYSRFPKPIQHLDWFLFFQSLVSVHLKCNVKVILTIKWKICHFEEEKPSCPFHFLYDSKVILQ